MQLTRRHCTTTTTPYSSLSSTHAQNPEVIKHLTNIIKTNVAACSSTGHPFVIQLGKIYLDLLNVYKCISEMISSSIARNGMGVRACVLGGL